jgi:hypothetical protein
MAAANDGGFGIYNVPLDGLTEDINEVCLDTHTLSRCLVVSLSRCVVVSSSRRLVVSLCRLTYKYLFCLIAIASCSSQR